MSLPPPKQFISTLKPEAEISIHSEEILDDEDPQSGRNYSEEKSPNEDKPLNCHECEKNFAKPRDLKAHPSSIHDDGLSPKALFAQLKNQLLNYRDFEVPSLQALQISATVATLEYLEILKKDSS